MHCHRIGARLAAIEATADAELGLGRPQAALILVQDALLDQPDREGLVRRLMLTLYRLGRQADALTAFATFRRVLDDDYGIEPSAELRELHGAILAQSEELALPDRAPHPAVRSLPARNPRFTGRAPVLDALNDLLEDQRTVVLTGLGGAGKSAIALELAHRHPGVVWWVTAESEASTLAGLTTLVRAVSGRIDITAATVWHGMESLSAPLIVFDNATDPAALRPFLPSDPSARVIVTSRNPAWGAVGATVTVTPFNAQEAESFLVRRIAGGGDRRSNAALCTALGGLPLALEQAAAYIEQVGMSVADYISLFRRRRDGLLRRGIPHDYPATVRTTWQLAFEQLEAMAPAAARLLNVLAHLAPDRISLSMLRELFADTDDPELALADAVSGLRRFSLVDRDALSLRIHRLVQAVVRDRLDEAGAASAQGEAIDLLCAAEPGSPDDPANWPQWEQLAPHIISLATGPESGPIPSRAVPLFRGAARYLLRRGSPRAGADVLHATIRAATATGLDGPDLGLLHSELGDLLDAAGDIDAARREHTQAVDILAAELDADDHRLAMAGNRLAHVTNCAGDHRRAVQMHERALSVLRGQPFPRDTATALVDLGYAAWAAHDLERASAAFAEALEVLVENSDHQLHADALAGAAMVGQDQGRPTEALTLFRRAYDELADLYQDADHPELAQALDKIGYVLRLLGRLDESVQAHERAVSLLSSRLGPTDPRVAMALTNLGLTLFDRGDRRRAAGTERRAADIFQDAYGPAHPHTRMARERLADMLAAGPDRPQTTVPAPRPDLDRSPTRALP